MKQLRNSIGYMFKDYMMELIGEESSIEGKKAAEIGFQLLSLIAEASYTLSGEASTAFHTAMGNCNVGKKKIADMINKKREIEGRPKTDPNRVTSNLDYARKKIRKYLDKEIIHINA